MLLLLFLAARCDGCHRLTAAKWRLYESNTDLLRQMANNRGGQAPDKLVFVP